MNNWEVHGTRAGSLPVRVEKRGQKVVTIVQNVTKAPEVLLFALKRSLGTGGNIVGPGVIEIQGNKKDLVEAHLLDCPLQLKGVAGLREAKTRAAALANDGHHRKGGKGKAVIDAPAPGDNDERGGRRRDKPRWDRRDKESERRFVASGCSCSWIYCSGNSCKEVAATARLKAEEAVFGELDDPWVHARTASSNTASTSMTTDELDRALRKLNMLSEVAPKSIGKRSKASTTKQTATTAKQQTSWTPASAAAGTGDHRASTAPHHHRHASAAVAGSSASSWSSRSGSGAVSQTHRHSSVSSRPGHASAPSVDPRRLPDRKPTSNYKPVAAGAPRKVNTTKPSAAGYLGSQRKGQQRSFGASSGYLDDYDDYYDDFYNDHDDYDDVASGGYGAGGRGLGDRVAAHIHGTTAPQGYGGGRNSSARHDSSHAYTHTAKGATSAVSSAVPPPPPPQHHRRAGAEGGSKTASIPAPNHTHKGDILAGQATVPTREALEPKYVDMIQEVLGNDPFDWDAMLNSMGFGISERDSFLAALELSLSAAARRKAAQTATSIRDNTPFDDDNVYSDDEHAWAQLGTADAYHHSPHSMHGGYDHDYDHDGALGPGGFWDYDGGGGGGAGGAPAARHDAVPAGRSVDSTHDQDSGASHRASATQDGGGGGGAPDGSVVGEEDAVNALVNMGFDMESVLVCLTECGGNVQRATERLLDMPTSTSPSSSRARPEAAAPHKKAPSMKESGYQLGPRQDEARAAATHDVHAANVTLLQNMGFSRQAAEDALYVCGTVERAVEHLTQS
eukprot:m.118490 g.118490  ORF g.118490 m.118490 type:complete len:790 (+) comp10982_c0_seq2:341-2710(+)